MQYNETVPGGDKKGEKGKGGGKKEGGAKEGKEPKQKEKKEGTDKGKGAREGKKEEARGKEQGGKPEAKKEEKKVEPPKPEAKTEAKVETPPPAEPHVPDPKIREKLQAKMQEITEEQKKVNDEWGKKFDDECFKYEKEWKKIVEDKENEWEFFFFPLHKSQQKQTIESTG